MQVSKNFKRKEFACQCGCGFDVVDVKLIEILQAIRDHYQKPIHITSACRCLKHNRSVGSKDTSQHALGKATDIYIVGISAEEIRDTLRKTNMKNFGGIGIYPDWKNKGLHIDVRDKKTDWLS